MSYTLDSLGYLDLGPYKNDLDKRDACWEYFFENLSSKTIVAFDGILVRGFTTSAFAHIVSGSSSKRPGHKYHDIPFVESRARCLPLIGDTIGGKLGCLIWRRYMHRQGNALRRRVLSVMELTHRYFLVVLDEAKGHYRFRTAYPATKHYFENCVVTHGHLIDEWNLTKPRSRATPIGPLAESVA